MNASGLFVVLGGSHHNSGIGDEVELGQLGVLVERLAVVLEGEVGEEKGEDVRIQVLAQFEQELVLEGLNGN